MLVLAKGSYGLGGNIAVLAEALHLANRLGCQVAADWKNGMYQVDDANVAELLFDHPSLTPLPSDLGSARVWPPEWQDQVQLTFPERGVVDGLTLGRVTTAMAEEYGLDNLQRDFDVIVITRESPKWYGDDLVPHLQALIPNAEIRRRVTETGTRPTDIGVHFRHGNGERTVVPPNILWFFARVDEFLAKEPSARIFLCTDCSAVLSRFQERYKPGQIITSPKEYPPLGAGGMHYAPTSSARLESAVEAAVDIWALGNCGYFVGGISFFGRVARKLAHPQPADHVATLKKRDVYQEIEGRTPVLETSDLGKYLLTQGVLLDGLRVTADTTPRKLYYLFQELGSFHKPTDLNLDLVRGRLGYVRLY